MNDPQHPVQPIVKDAHGTLRFKKNEIVQRLLDLASKHGMDLNRIAASKHDREDYVQLMQLIGYSVGGFGDLSCVTDEDYARATAQQCDECHGMGKVIEGFSGDTMCLRCDGSGKEPDELEALREENAELRSRLTVVERSERNISPEMSG